MTSPCLGQQTSSNRNPGTTGPTIQVRRFRKTSAGRISIDIPQWLWWLREAVKTLGLKDVDPTCIRVDQGFDSPSLFLYNRRWNHGDKVQQECFEAIREGTVLTIPLYVASPEDPKSKQRPPSQEEVVKLFEFVGKWLGISPWGGKFGYGRFTVEACLEL